MIYGKMAGTFCCIRAEEIYRFFRTSEMPEMTRRMDVIFRTVFSFKELLHFMPAKSPRNAKGNSSRADFTVLHVRSPSIR